MKFGPLGIWEILLILVVILLIFGPRRLPEMAKGIGQSVREFRKGIRDMKDDIDRDDAPKKATVVETPVSPTTQSVSAAEVKAEPVPQKEEAKPV
jgi:sec-independent protein translocase protein TatA